LAELFNIIKGLWKSWLPLTAAVGILKLRHFAKLKNLINGSFGDTSKSTIGGTP
jgi:hypothetical protein